MAFILDGRGHKLSMPRCSDCANTITSAINTTDCELLLGVGQRLVPWGDVFQPWDRIDHTKLDLTDPSLDHDAESTRIACLAWQHCSETDAMPDRCDYLVLFDRVLHWGRQLLLYFLALLFAVPLVEDIDSALIEEALPDSARPHWGKMHWSDAPTLRAACTRTRPAMAARPRAGLHQTRQLHGLPGPLLRVLCPMSPVLWPLLPPTRAMDAFEREYARICAFTS